jgi:uncharacterized protein (DUF1501 family)
MNTDGLKGFHRRAFLQRAAALGGMGAASSLALQLACVGEAAAFNATDYRALVCVFLFGGNDYANTLIPRDLTNYDRYAAIRGGSDGRTAGGIAYGLNELSNTALTPVISQTLTDDINYAFNPALVDLKNLFHEQKLGVLLNVGPLVTPLTKAQYQSTNRTLYPLPPKLFSHNDQQSVWQSQSAEGSTIGWGGLLGDIALSSNSTSALTCISVTGNAVYLYGRDAIAYQIGTSGAVKITPATSTSVYSHTEVPAALTQIITATSGHVLENDFSLVTKRAMNLEATVNDAIAPINLSTNFDPDGVSNSLANQLKMVARLIGARNSLGLKRQVFFVSLGGFDNHDALISDHAVLMGRVNEAMNAFYAATVELGVADKVTSFTASDFGRTLSSNGDGSDHGWGSHSLIMGGAVQGGRFFGKAPSVSVTSDDQVGQGRLLPTTSVDQLASTLGLWFGLSQAEVRTIMPRIGNFATDNLGFL